MKEINLNRMVFFHWTTYYDISSDETQTYIEPLVHSQMFEGWLSPIYSKKSEESIKSSALSHFVSKMILASIVVFRFYQY